MSKSAKVEALSRSPKGGEDTAPCVVGAGKTIRELRSVHANDLEAKIQKGNVGAGGMNAKISFELEAC